MSVVSLLGVKVLNNPAKFSDAYEFEITFECLEQLQKGTRSNEQSVYSNTHPGTRSRMEANICRICHFVSMFVNS